MPSSVFFGDKGAPNADGFYEVGSNRFFRNFNPTQGIVAELHPFVVQNELLKTETLISPNQALTADHLDSRQYAENRAGSLLKTSLEVRTQRIGQPHVSHALKSVETAELGHTNP
jgi:hypothetical protein